MKSWRVTLVVGIFFLALCWMGYSQAVTQSEESTPHQGNVYHLYLPTSIPKEITFEISRDVLQEETEIVVAQPQLRNAPQPFYDPKTGMPTYLVGTYTFATVSF